MIYWFVLPAIQSRMIPNSNGAEDGPWVIRTIFAIRACAVAVLTCVTTPVILSPLRKAWAREDIELGTLYDPFRDRPIKRTLFFLQGALLLSIYASALVFYLFSWTTIHSDGIDQRLPWTTLHHSFQDIETLETIPEGKRSDSLVQNGPWYSIMFRSGRYVTFSLDNEGLDTNQLREITAFIAKQSGISWEELRGLRLR
jgi:hypothetical protein